MSLPCADGTLLAGKIIYRQPITGYRTGIEPILLAAAIPARPGDRVLEAGTGAGAGLLAVNHRIPNLIGLGLERDPAMAEIAAANFAANNARNLEALTTALESFSATTQYDHAFANPPWHSDDGTAPPDPARRNAKLASATLLTTWASALAKTLRRRGTLTFILPAAALAEAATALAKANCHEQYLIPLWPHQNDPAKLMILQGVKEGRGPCRLHPGLVLHEPDGRYTPDAQALLRDGGELRVG